MKTQHNFLVIEDTNAHDFTAKLESFVNSEDIHINQIYYSTSQQWHSALIKYQKIPKNIE